MDTFQKNRAYKSCCSSEMRPVARHPNSPVHEVENRDNNVFEIDPSSFETHTSVVVKNIPSSFVFQKEASGNQTAVMLCFAFLFSVVFESVLPVFLWTCAVSFENIVLAPHAPQESEVSVIKIGLRDNAFVLNDVCRLLRQTLDDVVVVIDRPSVDLWGMLTGSDVFKKAINQHPSSRLVVVPSMWQTDKLSDVFDFASDVWSVYCDDSDCDPSPSPGADSALTSRNSSSGSLVSEFSMGEISPSFVGVVGAVLASK